jgi:hypothetical protein
MNTFQPIVIISAELANSDRYLNQDRTNRLRSRLLEMGLAFDGVKGVYKGVTENSFMVVTSDVEAMKKLAREFSQESILSSDANRNTTIHFTKGEDVAVGRLKQVTKEETSSLDNYTIVLDNNREYFFAATK